MSFPMTMGQWKIPGTRVPSVDAMRSSVAQWLLQGVSPERLALTLALGCAIGCIPVVGIPTLLCAALALALKLNLPAIQAANYIVMPLQLILIVPFVRLGSWLISSPEKQTFAAGAMLHSSPERLVTDLGSIAGRALLAWVVLAVPAVLLLTLTLTFVLRRIPALAEVEAAD